MVCAEDNSGQSQRIPWSSSLDNTALVRLGSSTTLQPTVGYTTSKKPVTTPISAKPTSTTPELTSDGLSGIPSDNLDFLGKPQKSSWHHGGVVPRNSIRHTSKNGWHFLLKGTSITVYQKLVRHFGSL